MSFHSTENRCKPLKFRQFSGKLGGTAPITSPISLRQATPEKREPKTTQEIPRSADRQKLDELLLNLDKWEKGDTLVGDQDARGMLADLIRKAMPWDDQRFPPLEVWRSLLGEGSNYRFIDIEGMRSKLSGTKFSIRFERTKETRGLLEALMQHRYAGNKSWNFPHGEMHKRTVAAWVRKHGERIIAQLQPQNGLETRAPVACAVQFLATYALVERRAKLPQELPELVKVLLADSQDEVPTALSKDWMQLVEDMRIKRPDIKHFLLKDIDAPQGRRAREINFINPMQIIQEVATYINDPTILPPGDEYQKDFWHTRYEVFGRVGKYSELAAALDCERSAIGDLIDGIESLLYSA
jgi:hypothetical protein